MKFLVALPVLAVALGAATAAEAQRTQRCVPVTQAQVDAQFAKFNAAWQTKNPDTVTAMFGDNAVLLATVANRPRTTKADIRDYFVSFLKSSPFGTPESSTYDLGCNMATRVGTWNVKLTNPDNGEVNNVKARYTFIYKYEGGRWVIDHLHSSVFPPQP